MTRFLMSIDDAVSLVVEALTLMRGGETFVPKLSATTMPELASVIAPGCAQRVIGIRPGEKLHETLVTTDEAARTIDTGRHYVIEPTTRTWGTVSPLAGIPVSPDFTFRSDTARRLTWSELKELAA
jgi:UDP-N-acetylglucosamine 4,6-dehydratase